MNCIRCSREIETDSVFCPYCGAPVAPRPAEPRRLVRLPDMGRLGGVCAGIAAHLDTDVTLVRLAWVILSIWPGALVLGMVVYLVAWMLMPAAPAGSVPAPTATRLFRSRTNRVISGVCGGLAEYLGADATVVRLVWAILTIVPGAIVFGVVAYLVAWIIVPEAPDSMA